MLAGMTEAEEVMAEYRIAERYSEWQSAQALADRRLDELNNAIRAAVATRAWGIRASVCRVTSWSREHIRRLTLSAAPVRSSAGLPVGVEGQGGSTR